jgi:two-component system, LuxR family, response regulator FixJ
MQDNYGDKARAQRMVVVVDDDPAVLNSLKFSLEIEGFTVRTYHSARALLDAEALPPCGCLVVDFILPDMDGLELVGRLRNDHCSLPAILVTSHPNAALRRRANAAGVNLVEKPLLSDALVEAINDALMHQRNAPSPSTA